MSCNARNLDDIRKIMLSRFTVDASTGCWEWTGSRDRWGYGKIRYEGKYHTASRVAWHAFVGDTDILDQPGVIVRHICENPPCINPEHLEPGLPGIDEAAAEMRLKRYFESVRKLDAEGGRTVEQIRAEMRARVREYYHERVGSKRILCEKILASTRTPSGCWEWIFRRDEQGYGKAYFGGRHMTASRASYLCFVGDIPEGLVIRHTCDNPPCVNPEHLIVGTTLENVADRMERVAQYIAAVRAAGTDRGRTDAELIEELRTRGQSFRRRK